jgi:ABC-2 type transport system permease protein
MARLRPTLVFARALLATNLRASLALRGAFWLQAAFMIGNNLAFFALWGILFARFREIGGWKLGDMLILYGVVAGGYGLSVVFFGGTRSLARAIVDGELDPLLVQPKPVLLQALGSTSSASGWGDFATAVAMFAVAGLDWRSLPLVVVAVLASGAVFTAAAVTVQSLAFWLGEMEQLARQVWEFTLAFSLYPKPLFSGSISFLLYTLIPAGFVGFLPVELVRAPSLALLAGVLAAALGWWLLALLVFHAGLRRYESGNRFGARG